MMEDNNNNTPAEEITPVQENNSAEPTIAQVFEEEVVAVQDIKSNEVDESDFAAGDSETKTEEEKIAEEKKGPEVKKDPPEEKKKTPEASKNADEKNAVVRRMFNPETALLAFDILARKGGRMATPDRPDYFRMSKEDETDFKTLLRLTAEEEDWSAIPTKWLLAAAGGFFIFGKIYKWNKPHLWDEKELGDKFVKKPDEKEIANAAIAEYVREKARTDSEGQNKDLKEMVAQLIARSERQDKMVENLLSMMTGRAPGAEDLGNNIHDTPYTEIIPEKFLHGYDMDIIEFTDKGALIDPTKAGESGFTVEGMKIGRPTKQDGEIWTHFKQYHAWKVKHLKVA